jgi:DNA invertase Pin-like site-specific DNA recombinase
MSAVRTVVCYLRTANPPTVAQRLLARQRRSLQAACDTRGWTVMAWIEDLRQSGTTLDRPGLRHALALLADHRADALIACDHSRLAVEPRLASALRTLANSQGWQLVTLSPSPTTMALAARTGPRRRGSR